MKYTLMHLEFYLCYYCNKNIGRDASVLTSILKTKIYYPPLRSSLVPRQRLVERLEKGLRGPLTLVSAPAGYGKTTLMSEWHAGTGKDFPVAWFSIDNGDNNQFRFWGYIIAALSALDDGLVNNAATLLLSPQFPPAEEFITSLINSISSFSKDFALVLDDYHLITALEIHQYLTYLVEHQPPRMHLVLLTRSDPSLPLARLRARGQLMELRSDDLRFTPEEAAEFLNTMMGLDLTAENISALEQRTEGWVAGLQMAALSMQGKEDVNGFINAFTGSHRYILDYLAEEVLGQQPETIRTFLLRTSILDRMNGSLCDAVTCQKNGEQMLAELEHQNLFIIPLDNDRRWYRYHHLLTDLLLMRLKQERKDSLNELYFRAANWCERNDNLEEAVHYALAARDYEFAALLISQVKDLIWGRGSARTMLEWMKMLPEEFLHSKPKYCMSYAAGLTITGYTEAAEKWLQVVEDHLHTVKTPSERERLMPAEISIYRSVGARFRGNFAAAATLSQRGLELIPGENLRGEGIALLFLGHAYFYAGDAIMAEKTLLKAIQTNLASGHIAACLNAYHHLAQLRLLQARLHEAKEIYQQAIEFSKGQGQPVFVGVEHTGLGDLKREWNDLAAAAEEVNRGVSLAEAADDIFFLRDAYLAAAQLAQSQKDWETALTFLYKAEQAARRYPDSVDIGIIQAWRARLQLVSGNFQAAAKWAKSCDLSVDDELCFLNEFSDLTLARVLLSQGNLPEAERLLKRLVRAAEAGGRTGRVIEISIVLTLVKKAQGKLESAMEILERVLSLAEPEGYVRIFLDEGEPMLDLLRRAASKGLHTAYVGLLLSNASPSDKGTKPTQPLIEPLSERELEILQLVVAGKSNQEIADELVLAIGTVKRHVSNIFLKLNVKSRTRCIAQARELKLI
jgi:LuxR family transcriptional regulator, maltose regulon positive regulatory protein